jgi:hypothetical protein
MTEQMSDLDKLESSFAQIIDKMEHRFTSHEFILRLAHTHQNEYIGALASYRDNGSPFKDLHHELIKRLRKLDGNLIVLHKTDYPSRDIFDVVSSTSVWRKK